MSFSLAIGLLMLIGAWWIPALIAFACFIPSFAVMALVERKASRDRAAANVQAGSQSSTTPTH